ncbi:restriction endonuclease subunit S [Campylobacter lanienae]|uniref:restriction endonuclease subunit S n=1 Tax=Campylobacter lanienae TaxID=75658 RepID=UPI000BB43170|nr:restriction endonuclease subunit S [Campylobacter lanienae]
MSKQNMEFKDSGIPWIGQIPKHWEIKKVKDGFYLKKDKALIENPVVLTLARSGIKVRDLENNDGQFAKSYFEYNPVDIDDILLNTMDLQSGANCNISKIKGVISPAYANLRYKNSFSPNFYNYYFKIQYWTFAFFTHGKGVSYENRWTLNNQTLMRFPLLVPPLNEQEKIAEFLDKKCEIIDKRLSNLERKIKSLKEYKKSLISECVTKGLNPKNMEFKDSGIPWIGQIPKHWEVTKIKYVIDILTDYTANGSFADLAKNVQYLDYEDYARLVRLTDLRENLNNFGIYVDKNSYEYLSKSSLFGKEILVANVGAYSGLFWEMPKVKFKATLAPNMFMIKTNKKIMQHYFYYLGISNIVFDILQQKAITTAQPKLNKTDIKTIYIPLPPLNEQKEIAEFLDKKCEKIDRLNENYTKQITALKEYKKSLIYECVTGKNI